MPDIPRNLKTTRSIASLRHVRYDALGKNVILEVPDGFARETRTDEEEEGG